MRSNCSVGIEHVHVAGDDAQIGQAALARLGFDVFALRVRVRHRSDLRMRKLPRHPQRQRAPAAAEFEDRLAVGEIGVLDGLAQRLFLGLLQRGCRLPCRSRRNICGWARAPVRRTPPAPRSAARWPRRCIRRWRGPPSRRRRQRRSSRITLGKPRCGARAQAADRGADDRIRQRHPLGGADNGGDEIHVATPLSACPFWIRSSRIMREAAAERNDWYATDTRDSARRASAASAPPAAGCRSRGPGSST